MLASYYATGTASVASGSKAVTGQGTAWASIGLKPGDTFIGNDGRVGLITSVNSNTSITLVNAWPGTTQATKAYAIQPVAPGVDVGLTVASLLETLDNGTLEALANAGSGANKLPYYNGSGSAALTNLTPAARAMLALTGANGKIPVFTGSGSAAARDIVGTVSQSGGVPTGALMEAGASSNGRYFRFANGIQICLSPPVVPAASTSYLVAGSKIYRSTDSESYLWAFPATFVSIDDMNIFVTTKQYDAIGYSTIVGSSTALLRLLSVDGPLPPTAMRAGAIGRWF